MHHFTYRDGRLHAEDVDLRHLADTFGARQLFIGTDYPFNFHDPTPVQRIEQAGFDETTALDLICHNAERFLGRALHTVK